MNTLKYTDKNYAEIQKGKKTKGKVTELHLT